MPLFTLHVRADSAAFYDDAGDYEPTEELARLLYATANRMRAGEEYGASQTLLDVNGNTVGQFSLKGDQGECLTVTVSA